MRNKGVALISVLIAMAIITPIIYQVAWRQKINLEKAIALKSTNQPILDALAIEMWARNTLLDDAKQNTYDSYMDAWHQALPTTFSEASIVSGQIEDLTAKLNLNNLWYADDEKFVKILLELFINLGIDQTTATRIMNALQDWMDNDNRARAVGGAEDNYYMLLDSPYRASNNLMVSISELKLLRGMEADIYEKVSPYLTALSAKTKINLNTASLPVLLAIFPQKARGFLETNIEQRDTLEFASIGEFQQAYKDSVNEDIQEEVLSKISVYSNFFSVEANSRLGNSQIILVSILQRDNVVKVINRFFKY